MSSWQILNAECVAMMQTMEPDSIDAIVCDPPYDLIGQKTSRNGSISTGNMKTPAGRSGPSKARGFMGMHWDGTGVAFAVATWQAALRVAKPGAHLIAFGGTRTYHRMVVAIEDAGWEIRDCIVWHYATGFPKSRDIGKDIDRMAGAEREAAGTKTRPDGTQRLNAEHWASGMGYMGNPAHPESYSLPATDEAKQWDGWGTALKPATELIVLARKPMNTTVARNVLAYGTGALNVDGCRIATNDNRSRPRGTFPHSDDAWGNGSLAATESHPLGRWPANVAFDEAMAAELDRQSGITTSAGGINGGTLGDHIYGEFSNKTIGTNAGGLGDTGGASRFFFQAKAASGERWGILTCNCETAKLAGWEDEDQNQNAQTDYTSPQRGICEDTSMGDSDSHTLSSGSDTTAPCHPDTKSITKTSISSTTRSTISNLSHTANTSEYTADANCETVSGGNPVKSANNSSQSTPTIGISRKKDGPKTGDVGPVTLLQSLLPSVCEKCGGDLRISSHPTQKPETLMRHLVRLVTPPGGVVLDPFCGSGTTGCACVLEDFAFIGIEQDTEHGYIDIARARIAHYAAKPKQRSLL